jgi:hypothetical protein
MPPEQGSDSHAMDAESLRQLLHRRLFSVGQEQLSNLCLAEPVMGLSSKGAVSWPKPHSSIGLKLNDRQGTQRQVRIVAHKLHQEMIPERGSFLGKG